MFFGKVDTYQGRMQMTNPLVDLIGDKTGRIVALYPQSEKLRITTVDMSGWVEARSPSAGCGAWPSRCPSDVRRPVRASSIARVGAVGHPCSGLDGRDVSEARRRLVFDELLRVQLALVLRKRALERTATGIATTRRGALVRAVPGQRLPFPLTAAQQRTIAEITADLGGPHPMHRLLQGDVGSGKTVVAVERAAHGGAGRPPGRADGADRGAGRAALQSASASSSTGLEVPASDDEGSLFAGQGMDRPLRIELLTNRTTPTNRRKLAEALAAARSTCSSAPTR